MKTVLITVVLILSFSSLSALSTWTGNATVSDSADFPGLTNEFRAASNAFPQGSRLRVMNMQNGAETIVVITGRLETPGVFIMIEERAADEIQLPSDGTLPVRVTPIEENSESSEIATVVHEQVMTQDRDYNPALALEDVDLFPQSLIKPDQSNELSDAFVEEVEGIYVEPDPVFVIAPELEPEPEPEPVIAVTP